MNNKRTPNVLCRRTVKILATVIAMATLLAVQHTSAQVTLTGISSFSTDSSGNASGGTVWNTLGGDSTVDLFLIAGTNYSAGSFINGPSDAQAAINIPLTTGIYTYVMIPGQSLTSANFGMNLFFDGNNATPRISVFGPTQTNASPPYPSFGPDGSASTFTLASSTVMGANSLSYQDGNTLITLTDFRWTPASVYNIDRVTSSPGNPGFVGADGHSDSVGLFTLDVTTVPEPQSIALMALGAGALMIVRRKKS